MERFLFLFSFLFLGEEDCYFFLETELSLTKQPLYLRPGRKVIRRSEYSLLMNEALVDFNVKILK